MLIRLTYVVVQMKREDEKMITHNKKNTNALGVQVASFLFYTLPPHIAVRWLHDLITS